MEYKVISEKWENGNRNLVLNGHAIPCADGRWMPPAGTALGMIQKPYKGILDETDFVRIEDAGYQIKPLSTNLFTKNRGWIKAEKEDGSTGYIAVVGKRKGLIGITSFFIISALLLLTIRLMPANPNPQTVPAKFMNSVKARFDNPNVHGEVTGYATYQSVNDQEWNAGKTKQKITLMLPASTTSTDKNGNTTTEDNPVYASPHIYIDTNKDGKFTEDECYYNPITVDENGEITDLGEMLEPGMMTESVDLVKPLGIGDYDAELEWTPIKIKDHTFANPMVVKPHTTKVACFQI